MAESTTGPQKATRPVSLLASLRLEVTRAGASSNAGMVGGRSLASISAQWQMADLADAKPSHAFLNERLPGELDDGGAACPRRPGSHPEAEAYRLRRVPGR